MDKRVPGIPSGSGRHRAARRGGARVDRHLLAKRARMQGFLSFDKIQRHPEAVRELKNWVRNGQVRYREDALDELEQPPGPIASSTRRESRQLSESNRSECSRLESPRSATPAWSRVYLSATRPPHCGVVREATDCRLPHELVLRLNGCCGGHRRLSAVAGDARRDRPGDERQEAREERVAEHAPVARVVEDRQERDEEADATD